MSQRIAPKPVERAALCTAHNRSGKPCKRNPTPGWNVCKFHGAGGGRPATLPATILKNALKSTELRAKADALIESGADVLDLQRVAAMVHVLVDEVSERDRGADGANFALLIQCIETLRKCVEAVERVRASKAFTTAEYQLFIASMAAFVEGLPEEYRAGAAASLQRLALPNRALSAAPGH